MRRDEGSGLSELATAVAHARVAELEDVFLERRAEVCWHLAEGRVTARETLLREGAAVRRDGTLVSGDGLDRPILARLLGIASRALPPFSAPAFPDPPQLEEALPRLPAQWASVRWSWRWAAILADRRAVALRRPDLAEVTLEDGHRALTVWPPGTDREDSDLAPATRVNARVGAARVLLAPAAAAVLLHELIGHPLEGDLLLRGASPWSGRQGERLVRLSLSVSDDPSRTDLPGAFSTDDEGEPAQPRELLAEGILVGALADRESAAALGVPTGNARRANVHARPRPRISNLVAHASDPLPHPPRHEAAIEVETLTSGTMEPASGAILLHVRTAFALRRGERHRPLAPFTLVGSLAAVRSGLLAAAEPTLPVAEPGWCAKDGEIVPTGAIAPWLLLSGLEVR
ncbi:MAG TPA: metallopeptidase TldD-related protein [Thermoanaerobaculaceae bacterium]|nr:metallopeptidase TldD-related protein [Thermoanaerobaculaceae bacterium]